MLRNILVYWGLPALFVIIVIAAAAVAPWPRSPGCDDFLNTTLENCVMIGDRR